MGVNLGLILGYRNSIIRTPKFQGLAAGGNLANPMPSGRQARYSWSWSHKDIDQGFMLILD